jgi:hypothetical protein
MRPVRLFAFAAMSVQVACLDTAKSDDDDDDDDDGGAHTGDSDSGGIQPGTGDGTGSDPDECEGAAPVISGVDCENAGLQPHFETGADTPTLRLGVAFDDEDGDLQSYALSIYLDEQVDGSVSATDSPFSPVHQSLDVGECEGFSGATELTVFLTGMNPDYDTLYEWGIVVSDAHGDASEMFVFACITPQEDGSDGRGR